MEVMGSRIAWIRKEEPAEETQHSIKYCVVYANERVEAENHDFEQYELHYGTLLPYR